MERSRLSRFWRWCVSRVYWWRFGVAEPVTEIQGTQVGIGIMVGKSVFSGVGWKLVHGLNRLGERTAIVRFSDGSDPIDPPRFADGPEDQRLDNLLVPGQCCEISFRVAQCIWIKLKGQFNVGATGPATFTTSQQWRIDATTAT
jgi:hypothetical protein